VTACTRPSSASQLMAVLRLRENSGHGTIARGRKGRGGEGLNVVTFSQNPLHVPDIKGRGKGARLRPRSGANVVSPARPWLIHMTSLFYRGTSGVPGCKSLLCGGELRCLRNYSSRIYGGRQVIISHLPPAPSASFSEFSGAQDWPVIYTSSADESPSPFAYWRCESVGQKIDMNCRKSERLCCT
jgi:hypothetical protein